MTRNIQNPLLKKAMLRPFLQTAPDIRILESLDLYRDKEINQKISNQNLNQSLKICKSNYTRKSVSNQKVQIFVSVLEENLSAKNALKIFAKYLQDKMCKIKQMQNIQVTLKKFLNQLKTL